VIRILHGDCLVELPKLAATGERFHACVCDPPYGLEFMGRDWDAPWKGDAWQTGAGFAKPGIGERETPWPAFTSGNDQFGGANPTCATCGGRARGKKKCACASPDWRVKGAAPDKMYGRHRQMQTYQTWCEAWARAVYDVLLPGAYLLAFGGTRTSHRLVCAIEDAGFEIRDTVAYLYGSGFPKSLNLDKALSPESRCQCHISNISSDHENQGVSGDLCELRPTVLAEHKASSSGQDAGLLLPVQRGISRKGVGAARAQGDGGGIAGGASERNSKDEGRAQPGMERRRDAAPSEGKLSASPVRPLSAGPDLHGATGRLRDGAPAGDGPLDGASIDPCGVRPPLRSSAIEQSGPDEPGTMAGQPEPQAGGAWPLCGRCGKPVVPLGLGTALKPAFEPIVVARKPLSESTVAANVLRWGTGAINVDACRVPTADSLGGGGEKAETSGKFTNEGWRRPWMDDPEASEAFAAKVRANVVRAETLGRFPANVAHDGSEEVLAGFPVLGRSSGGRIGNAGGGNVENVPTGMFSAGDPGFGDTGSAARFFYTAKADKADRADSKHPTVKPVDLIRWLVTLACPPGGHVLDCFAGSGTTGEACMLAGFVCTLIEKEAQHVRDIEHRIKRWSGLDAPLFAKTGP